MIIKPVTVKPQSVARATSGVLLSPPQVLTRDGSADATPLVAAGEVVQTPLN